MRVACVGNSITYGAGIANREQNSYPAQLQRLLGNGYEVRNFGVNGRCAGRSANLPYVETETYRESLAFEPDVVLIGFGTNDSKLMNWKHHDHFAADYGELIASYQNLKSRPRVILLTPLICYLPPAGDADHIDSARIARFFVPTVQQLAYERGLEVIDMQHMFPARYDARLLPDRLHPSALGAGQMARRLALYLQRKPSEAKPVARPEGATDFNFYGYQGRRFAFDGVEARIVSPRREAKGRPWVWRARFWEHEPQTDVAMLEAGFHIVYCDVADLYGQRAAVQRWDKFYRWLQGQGFSKQCVLEGLSRGGLIVYNWAARYPKRVAAIYADAPVMNLKSWPVESERRLGEDPVNTRQLLQLVGARDTSELKRKSVSPLQQAARLARSKISILHVVGQADRVVPVDENTNLFEREMARLGHPITVIRKEGCDHHPHSLFCPEPIVRFLLKATGYAESSAPAEAEPTGR